MVTLPDPTMSMAQIGITFNAIVVLTKPELVTPLNRSRLLQTVLRGSGQFGGCCEIMIPMDQYIKYQQEQRAKPLAQRAKIQDEFRHTYRLQATHEVDSQWTSPTELDEDPDKHYVAHPGSFMIDDYQLNQERFYVHRVGRHDRRALMLFLDNAYVYVRRYYTDGSALPYLNLDFTHDAARTNRGEFWDTVADGLLNFRYPSLSSDSFHYVLVCIDDLTTNIIRTHPLLCTPLGCDFDGDEQNCVGISDTGVDAECRMMAASVR